MPGSDRNAFSARLGLSFHFIYFFQSKQTYCRFSEDPDFFLFTVVLYLSTTETFTLHPQGRYGWADLLKYVICK